ncbi:TNFAIP3-interacting protein 1-like [Anoplopoma fimbria]|uniref:TNFAIP3-interacting protein 1-like n=1 Tax=Anoplopoma fimbria TaxID=229290 RepID=UPI0023EBF67D|nr:TNFAIP3-interacting protein 1-like [Anoplopoma fimbria]
MSQHENTMDRRPVERSQTKDNRLYPSLPNTDRYKVCVADRSTGEKLHTAAVYPPDSLPKSEAAAASCVVRMKAQILLLDEQRQELLSINEKWAKEYRTMAHYYKERVQALKALLQHDHAEEEMSEEGENKVTLSKKVKDQENAWTGDELLKAEKEAEELRAQNSSLTRKGQHQHEEIRRLNKALDEALHTTQPLSVSSETLQDLWKHQAEVYKEDFLKERRDREKLKDKYLEQEKKYRKVHSELRVLKSQVTWTPTPRPVLKSSSTNTAACPQWEVRQINHHIQLQRRQAFNNKP